MGTMISMILPASMFLYVVQETQGEHRTTAKIILAVGFTCLIASTYTTLTATESHHHDEIHLQTQSVKIPVEHVHQTIKIPSNLSDLKVVKTPPTALKISKEILGDSKEIKVDDKKVNEKAEVDEKRKEPALPNPPDDKKDGLDKGGDPAKGQLKAVVEEKDVKGMEKIEKGADPLNEKRQLMSTDDSKGNEPLKSPLVVSGKNLLASQQSHDTKNPVNKSKDMGNKDVKKPDSRTKRHLEEKPTEIKIETTTGIRKDGSFSTKTTTILPTVKVTESSKNSSVVIIEPKSPPVEGVSPTETTTVDASSLDPHVGNETGKMIKSRDLKSSKVIGRKLHSVQPLVRSIWQERLKKRGSFRILRKKRKVTF